MSFFLGRVFLRSERPLAADCPLSVPEQPGLEEPRVWRSEKALLVHRQQTVTPEDCFERQPLALEDGAGALLFDGRLTERRTLRAELKSALSASSPDSALVKAAFEQWGEEAPSHLNGEFALAIYDGRRQRLIFATDANGTHPLYFHRSGNSVLFSTCLPALLHTQGVPREPDERVLADLLAGNHRDNRNSFFRGIQRVLGGETTICDADGERFLDHWPFRNVQRLRLKSDAEYLEAANDVLDRTVRSASRSIQPIPLMGSGGLDSSCLAVSMLRIGESKPVSMFTLVPEGGAETVGGKGRYVSERTMVEAMQGAFPRLQPHFVEPQPYPDAAFRPETIFEASAVPLRSIVNLGWAEEGLRQMRETGAQAYLDGGGGNFTFTWNGLRGLNQILAEGRWLSLANEVLQLGEFRPRPTARLVWHEMIRPRLPKSMRGGKWEDFSSLNLETAAEFDMLGRIRASGHDPTYAHPIEREAYVAKSIMTNRALIAEINGWTRARYGLEVRRPLMDARIIRFSLSLPVDQFFRKGQTRWLARRVLEQAGAPASIVKGTSRGQWCPEWFTQMTRRRDALRDNIALLRQSPLASRLIDFERITKIMNAWPTDARDADRRRNEVDMILTRAFHVGAFVRWAEGKNWSDTRSGWTAVGQGGSERAVA